MATFKKALLRVGTYESPDGSVVVTRERLANWRKQFRRMGKANQVVPSGWDHSDDVAEQTPMSVKAFSDPSNIKSAQKTVGRLLKFELTPDGNAAELTLDITKPDAIESCRTNTIGVSPIIFDSWRDGKGNEYRDCITHVDLVNHPVDSDQGQFSEVHATQGVCCAIRMSLDAGKTAKVFRMADDSDPTDDEEMDDDDSDESLSDDDETGDDTDTSSADRFKRTLAAMAEDGYALPPDTDESNFLERLETAVLTKKANTDDEPGDDEENQDDQNGAGMMPTETTPAFAAMSLKANAAHNYATNMHRMGLRQRLDALLNSGRCTAHEHKQKLADVNAVKLSLNSNGEPKVSRAEDWIGSREALPQGCAWDNEKRRLSLGNPTERPAPTATNGGDFTDDEASKIADSVFARKR